MLPSYIGLSLSNLSKSLSNLSKSLSNLSKSLSNLSKSLSNLSKSLSKNLCLHCKIKTIHKFSPYPGKTVLYLVNVSLFMYSNSYLKKYLLNCPGAAAWCCGHRLRLRNRRPGFESRLGVRFPGKTSQSCCVYIIGLVCLVFK
jgi:hypothetical protein